MTNNYLICHAKYVHNRIVNVKNMLNTYNTKINSMSPVCIVI